MQTTGFLILNTISNICTFITLALVLIILYYINKEQNKCNNKEQNKCNNMQYKEQNKCNDMQYKKKNKHRIAEEEDPPIKSEHKCIKNPFFNKYNIFNNKNRGIVTEESILDEEASYQNMNQNTFTPPFQETITFVPEKKNIGNNKMNTYLSNCS